MKRYVFLILILITLIRNQAFSASETMDVFWVNPDPTQYLIYHPRNEYETPHGCNNGSDSSGNVSCGTDKYFLDGQYFLQAFWKLHRSSHWVEVYFVSNNNNHNKNCGVIFDYGSPDQYPPNSVARCNIIRDANNIYIYPLGTTPFRINDDQFFNLLKYDKRD